MQELFIAPSSDRHPSPQVDIDIDLEQMEQMKQMEALADPTLSSEVRERNFPTDIDGKIQKEAALQDEYTRMIPLYLQLQEAIESGDMPDFRRVSASLPPEINALVERIATELMKLSLYASTERVYVKKELETMIRKHSFEERIEDIQKQRTASATRLERLQAAALDPEAENKRKAEALLADIKKDEEVPMIPMPVVSEKPVKNQGSFWGGIRSKMRGRLQ